MLLLEHCLEQSAAFHRHLCPRQVLGVRMGMLAAEVFTLELPQRNKRLYAFVETDGCFADGIMTTTGCALGHRTMRLMDLGKVAVTFVDTLSEKAIRIYPHPAARERAMLYSNDEADRWHRQLTAYQVMPTDELMCMQKVMLAVSLREIISKPGVRVQCSVCGEEIINQREICVNGKPLCRHCAGEAETYYLVTEKISPVLPS